MRISERLFPLSLMGFILVFALIHLGVAIGIIVEYHQYGDIFSPEVGLSAYNIVVAFFGLLTAVLGAISAFVNSKTFAVVVCCIAGVLGILSLASLITALVINSKSTDYVYSHFSSTMLSYTTSDTAKTRIDSLQTKYQCCGTHLWVDWARVALNDTETTTVATATANTASTGTGTATGMSTSAGSGTAAGMSTSAGSGTAAGGTTNAPSLTTVGNNDKTSSVASNPTMNGDTGTPGNSATTASSFGSRNVKRNLADIFNDHVYQRVIEAAVYSREKRDARDYINGLDGLPLTVNILLPGSCCESDSIYTDSVTQNYCPTTINGTSVNDFYHEGCARQIQMDASNQAAGYCVINSFMIALAFVAIPVMLQKPSLPL